MSVFGGDSWAREGQYRKRRVEDLMVEGLNESSYKKLSSGKYACLVCPNNPILDTPLTFSMHCKGSRHLAAESRMKHKELARRDEMNKRVALSDCSSATAHSRTSNHDSKLADKPLIEKTRKTALEIACERSSLQHLKNKHQDSKLSTTQFNGEAPYLDSYNPIASLEVASDEVIGKQLHLDYLERRKRELKFIAAGWKRDHHGKWHRDENAEFDSDEEDPNVSLG